MFRITRRHGVDHAPAFPSPAFRFPDGTAMPIHAEEEEPAAFQEPAATEDKDAV